MLKPLFLGQKVGDEAGIGVGVIVADAVGNDEPFRRFDHVGFDTFAQH